MGRITDRDLEAIVARINSETGMPLTPYVGGVPQVGNFHLSHAYGGVCLHRMSLKPGCTGISTPLNGGHVPKRQLYDAMHAFLRGIGFIKYPNSK